MVDLAKNERKGIHRFDFAITVIVISIMATLMLNSLEKLEKSAEKVTHDSELNNLRLGLAENWVHMSVSHQTLDVNSIISQNPMLFIKEVPNNYIGELSTAPVDQSRIWYFDTHSKQLVYMYNDGTTIGYRLVSTLNRDRASLLSMNNLDLVAVDQK